MCLDRNTIWPQVLSVKVGAMVMLVTVGFRRTSTVHRVADQLTASEHAG